MNRLTAIIGLAPSEVPPQVYLERLRKERTRVNSVLEGYKFSPPVRSGKPKKAPSPGLRLTKQEKELEAILRAQGISPADFLTLVKEGKIEVSK